MLITSNFRTNQSVSFNAKKKAPTQKSKKKEQEFTKKEIETHTPKELEEISKARLLFRRLTQQISPNDKRYKDDGRIHNSFTQEEQDSLRVANEKYGTKIIRNETSESEKKPDFTREELERYSNNELNAQEKEEFFARAAKRHEKNTEQKDKEKSGVPQPLLIDFLRN